MQKETVAKFKEALEAVGVNCYSLQGDNSNFFNEGFKGDAIILDDTNQIAVGIRRNDYSIDPPWRATFFEYDVIQYLTMELQPEQIKKLLEVLKADVTDLDVDTVAEKFKRSPLDKGWTYKR